MDVQAQHRGSPLLDEAARDEVGHGGARQQSLPLLDTDGDDVLGLGLTWTSPASLSPPPLQQQKEQTQQQQEEQQLQDEEHERDQEHQRTQERVESVRSVMTLARVLVKRRVTLS